MFLFVFQASNWNEDVIAKATVFIAVVTALYFLATVLLWLATRQSVLITKRSFEATYRPFIGVIGVNRVIIEKPPQLRLIVHFRNAGNVPANDVKISLKVVADGIILPDKIKEEVESLIMIPDDKQVEIAVIDDPKHYKAAVNATNLSLLFKCTYKGVTQKEYIYDQKITYNKEHGSFSGVKGIAT